LKNNARFFVLSFVLLLFSLNCGHSEDYVVLHQKTGPVDTNCYLLYDTKSREAALFDVGGPIDSLTDHIDENKLNLKYILLTHSHMDHIEGIALIKDKYPDALIGCNKEEYSDFLRFREWAEENMDKEMLESMRQHPEMAQWFEYDLSTFPKPDIYVEDNQVYNLGDLEIRTFLSPGHTIGSICYVSKDILFSGDVLFYRLVGRTDLLGGSGEAIVKSVRLLYTQLPDSTKVYPGHGPFTDIGTEKVENGEVTLTEVNLQN
jgi:hydroxyacylglutathione hydrolase